MVLRQNFPERRKGRERDLAKRTQQTPLAKGSEVKQNAGKQNLDGKTEKELFWSSVCKQKLSQSFGRYSNVSEIRYRLAMKKTAITSTLTTTCLQCQSAVKQSFERRDVKKFSKEIYSKLSSESFSFKSMNIQYSSVYERSFTSKSIGGGETRRYLGSHTKTSDHSDEQPLVAVVKDKSQVNVPQWMEEQNSPELMRRDVNSLNIDIFLTYPSNSTVRKNGHEDSARESMIRPEVAKRDEQFIPVFPVEEDDEEDEDDEFEEEIVVVDVIRHPLWRKGLQFPKPQPEKAGKPIADLLEVPTLQPKQKSTSEDSVLVVEKVESVERPSMVFAEPDFSTF